MQLPSIDITQTNAQIALRSERPPVQVKQHQADLQIRQQHSGVLQISKKASKLYIDQTEAFADANLKSPLRLAKEFTAGSRGKVAQYVAKTAQQGNQMMRIENGTEAIQRLAKVNSERPERQLTLAFMPKSMSKVRFRYQPSELTVNAPRREPDIRVTPRKPDIEIPKWQSEAYLKQNNQISFQAIGVNVNLGL